MKARLRLMTWNIHGSIGRDRKCDPDRVLRVIREADPDVLVLQEVDGRAHLGRRANAFEFFGEALGPHVCEARMFGKPGREHGNFLASRWPLAEERVHRLPGGVEPRGLVAARIERPGGAIQLLGSHFSLGLRARRIQAETVAAEAALYSLPVILCGDFNEWAPNGPVHQRLSAALPVHMRPRTWPARRPVVPMDRLYASRGVVFRMLQTSPEAALASDHVPLLVEVTMPPEADAS